VTKITLNKNIFLQINFHRRFSMGIKGYNQTSLRLTPFAYAAINCFIQPTLACGTAPGPSFLHSLQRAVFSLSGFSGYPRTDQFIFDR
jgi:hypothetical protein